ncbi:MAG: type II and III secretion system protein family protein [Xanthobacteraceae bacterium]|nr:type II and III secretion system protein family protein [Xanthobacteraceae bacterium]
MYQRAREAEASPSPQGGRSSYKYSRSLLVAVLGWSAICLLVAGPAHAQPRFTDDVGHRMAVTVNKSRTVHFNRPFETAVVASPEIADAYPVSDHELYIQGKRIGTTNISVYDHNGVLVGVIDLDVDIDGRAVAEKIFASTGNRGIRVLSSNGQIVLSGWATDAVAADRAVAIAKTYSPNGVINALTVAPSQQVLLKVRFLEATRQAGRELGVNWFGANASGTRGFTTGQGGLVSGSASTNTPGGIPLFQTAGTLAGAATSPFGVVLANIAKGNAGSVDVLITALETKGLVRRLAEPDLMALSGDTAQFLAGGEFPVPIAAATANGLVTPTIEFKPFGVRLSFTPTVLNSGIINLRIAPEVSELDFANAVTISGTTIPSLIKRDAVTTIELRDGQSFAIAGLLQANDARTREQIPWIGSVPVLGALFASSNYQKDESDLVIIVTPHLVQPAAPGARLATPLDQRLPSNDPDFFLMGKLELRKKYADYVTNGGGLVGPYGHILRVDPGLPEPVAPMAKPVVLEPK